MAADESERTTYLLLFDAHNRVCRVVQDDEPIIDAHVTRYLETGRDELLHLTMISGGVFHTRVSDIISWCVSSPESRDREDKLERELKKTQEWTDPE